MQTQIIISHRSDLVFQTSNLGSERTSESFNVKANVKNFDDAAVRIVSACLGFLPKKFRPERLWIDLEYNGKMQFADTQVEIIPLSIITSQQQPSRSRIRIGMHEIINDIEAFESILAHEMGHMLIEWPIRISGRVSVTNLVNPYWSKEIYEGVADWIAAVVTKKTIIGSKNIWFNRDIEEFATLADARDTIGDMATIIKKGLFAEQLIPNYRAYSEWMELVSAYFSDKTNPYAEGQWVASQLWKMAHENGKAKILFDRILAVALKGQILNDSKKFIDLLKSKGDLKRT